MGTIRDKNVAWIRKTIFFPAQTAHFTVQTGATGASASIQTEASTAVLLTTIPGSGGNATAFTAWKINGTTGVGINWQGPAPYDVDYSKSIGFHALYTHRTTGATALTTVTWLLQYNFILFPQLGLGTSVANRTGGTFLNTTAAPAAQPATALDTAITADTAVSGNTDSSPKVYVSPMGVLKASGVLTTAASASQLGFWQFRLSASAMTASHTDDLYLLGLLMHFDVRKTFGMGKNYLASKDVGTPILQNWLDIGYNPAINPTGT